MHQIKKIADKNLDMIRDFLTELALFCKTNKKV